MPNAPRVIDTAGGRRLNAIGVAVRDTLAFIPSVYDTMWVISVADPTSLRFLAGVPLGAGNWGYDATVAEDTLVYIATKSKVIAANVRDPAHPFVVASLTTPYVARRVVYNRPYVYVACYEAGILILDSATTGLSEMAAEPVQPNALRIRPNPTVSAVELALSTSLGPAVIIVRDVTGRAVLRSSIPVGASSAVVDVSRLAAGVFFVEVESCGGCRHARLIKL